MNKELRKAGILQLAFPVFLHSSWNLEFFCKADTSLKRERRKATLRSRFRLVFCARYPALLADAARNGPIDF
jgi:hypothetical protein